jgi:4-alpha-glucanotransferase
LADIQFEQYVFSKQWLALKRYANERHIRLFGDMPIFVAHDSAEVWANPDQFDLLPDGSTRTVAGVPPDYFSATGQRWGNPHYNWRGMKENGFAWWRQRVEHGLEWYDLIRIDHFRGFESYWEIDAAEPTAMKGHWVKTPGKALFKSLSAHFPNLPLVAEDLGTITPEVLALRDQFNFPGMKILQFGFDGDSKNPYLPHNYQPNCVVYTGTHDNDTTVNWFRLLEESTRKQVLDYLGVEHGQTLQSMPWPLIRMAVASTAALAMLPMQDLLGLGDGHRMNTPGSQLANWRWRFEWSQVQGSVPERLRSMNHSYGRL